MISSNMISFFQLDSNMTVECKNIPTAFWNHNQRCASSSFSFVLLHSHYPTHRVEHFAGGSCFYFPGQFSCQARSHCVESSMTMWSCNLCWPAQSHLVRKNRCAISKGLLRVHAQTDSCFIDRSNPVLYYAAFELSRKMLQYFFLKWCKLWACAVKYSSHELHIVIGHLKCVQCDKEMKF